MDTPTKTAEIVMKKEKDCKHSVCFKSDDPKARVNSCYVYRTMPGIEDATEIKLTVTILK